MGVSQYANICFQFILKDGSRSQAASSMCDGQKGFEWKDIFIPKNSVITRVEIMFF